MIRISLLLIISFFVSNLHSQTVFTEDFENSPSIPANWTNNDIQGGGDIWAIGSSGEAIGFQSPNDLYYSDAGMAGNYAVFDSDGYGDNGVAENAALESPVFDASSLSSVTLSYNHFFTAGFGGNAFVEVYDGSAWVEVASYTTPAGGDQSDSAFGLEEIDVSNELAGVSNAQVRFIWTGDWSWGWAFDNVEVFSCTESVPGLATNPVPADGATGVSITTTDNGETQVSFGFDEPSSGPVTSYTIIISDDPNLDQDANTISGTFSSNNVGNIFLPDQSYFEVSTTYYWAVVPENCAGTPSSNPTIWSFTTDDTLSNEQFELENFEFFVNNELLSLSASQSFEKINIFDLSGKQVMTQELSSNDENISIQSLASGLYLAKVQIGEQTKTFKFVK